MWDLIVSVPDHCLSFYFSNWHAQLQKLTGGLKFWLQKLETLHYLGSEQ